MSEPGSQNQPDEALVDLLIKQVTEGLSPAEQRALDVLDSAVARDNLRQFERAAAAVSLAGSANAVLLPEALAQRVARQAEEHFAASAGATGAADRGAGTSAGTGAARATPTGENVADLAAARSAAAARASASAAPRPAPSRSGAYGWFAAAACLVLAVFAWNRPPPAPPVAVVVPPPIEVTPPIPKPVVPPTPAEERAALMAKSDSMKITFGATKDPAAAGVSGDVVWDPVTQRGYLHFVGLAANDPKLRQYQLWIFDGGRDKRYPVDGGVFDIPTNATDVVIPIHAAVPVLSAKAFAVTVEKPGGVVVSGREHVVVLGAAS
jgi:Anti-sigma-K factor rskA